MDKATVQKVIESIDKVAKKMSVSGKEVIFE